MLRFAFRKRRELKTWTLVELVLGLPNLITLGIVLGTGDSAHADGRTPDVGAVVV